MTKRTIALILIFLFCLSLAACTGGGKPQKTEAPETSKTAAPEASEPPHDRPFSEVFDPETDFNNDLGRGYMTILSTDEAYYSAGTSGTYLYYYDKLTGECDVLCAKPECTHDESIDNEGCGGYIHAYTSTTVNIYQDKIYYIGMEDGGRTFNMYRMELDGTGREKLFTFESDSYYVPQHAYIHRGMLYGVQWGERVDGAKPVIYWNVTCWDLRTGEYKVICEDDEMPWSEPTLYFIGDHVLISASGSEETDDGREEITIKAFRYDIGTGQTEKLLDLKGCDYSNGRYTIGAPSEDRIYLANAYSGTVYLISEGELKEAFSVGGVGSLTLFSDKIVAGTFEHLFDGDLNEVRWNVKVLDYEGNVLIEDTFGFDPVLTLSDRIDSLGLCGVYGDGDALLVGYGIGLDYDEDADPNEEPTGLTCVVRYVPEDGKFTGSVILVEKWA